MLPETDGGSAVPVPVALLSVGLLRQPGSHLTLQRQLGEVQQAGKQMSQTAQTLEGILGGAKSRGSLGEVTLERLLEDSLPRAQYEMHALANSE